MSIIHFELSHLDREQFFDYFLKYPTGQGIQSLTDWYENICNARTIVFPGINV